MMHCLASSLANVVRQAGSKAGRLTFRQFLLKIQYPFFCKGFIAFNSICGISTVTLGLLCKNAFHHMR